MPKDFEMSGIIYEQVKLLGCKVSNFSTLELIDAIYRSIRIKNKQSIMLSANIHSINLAQKNSWLKDLINKADLVRNDSMGLYLASRILNIPLKSRITWADFGWDLAEFCSKKKISLFFLGGKNQVAEMAKERMIEKFPSLRIVGTHHGYFDKTGQQNTEIIGKINEQKPDILIVGFGMPMQEKWILDNKDKLNVKIMMTGGNCFSYFAGLEKRAPLWMRNFGLEWLFRFFLEPQRLFKRYIIGNPLFMIRILLEKYKIYKY